MSIANRAWSDYPVPSDLLPVVIPDPSLPLISIVTPSYNQGRFIRETIESVLTQPYPNIEYWVIDGGSSDKTVNILRSYDTDPRFHWISERDAGQADAVNKGWRRCRGELVGWLNSDDVYLPSALTHLSRPLIERADVDIVYGDAQRVAHDGAPIERMYGRPLNLTALLRENYINQPAVLQRRRVIEALGPLQTNLHYALDYDFYLRAALQFTMQYVPELCATYRMHEVSKTTTGGSAFAGELAMVVDGCFANPAMPVTVRAQRRKIQSDWLLQITLEHLKEHHFPAARRTFFNALRRYPLRPRMIFVLLLALDSALHTSFHQRLLAVWRQRRGRRFYSRSSS